MQTTFQKSLASKLLRIVLGFYFVIAITLTLVQLALEFRNEKQRLEEEISSKVNLFTPVITQALWNFDDEQMDITVNSILKTELIIGVDIFDDQGEKILSKWHDIPIKKAQPNSIAPQSEEEGDLYSYKHPLQDPSLKDGPLGHVVVYTSSSIVIERAAYTFTITIINAMIKTICLWLIFYLVLKHLLAKPLGKLTEKINQLNPDINTSNLEGEVELTDFDDNTIRQNNELGNLIQSFFSMQSALKEKNNAIINYQQHLEEMVNKRTEAIRRLNDQLTTVSQAKTDFLANMSHEIRTPMNGVFGVAELLKDTNLDDSQHEYVQTIQNSCQALITVINDILDFSKIESGNLDLENIPFNLEQMIFECGSIFALKASDQNLKFTITIEKNTPTDIYGDPTRLRQIILNLLGNAFKFTDIGAIGIRVRKINLDNRCHALKIEIKDTGIGISEDAQNKLFKTFSQADSSTTRKYGGTGLGLAISKKLVTLMGGNIGIESQFGLGSVFWFSITLNEASPPPPTNNLNNLVNKKSITLSFEDRELEEITKETLSSYEVEVGSIDSDALSSLANSSLASIDKPNILIIEEGLLSENLIEKLSNNKNITDTLLIYCHSLDTASRLSKLTFAMPHRVIQPPLSAYALKQGLASILNNTKTKKYKKTTVSAVHLNVLVAEDNPVNQIVMKGALKKLGITPDVKNNGLEALHQYTSDEKTYDLILMDCEMPELDGWNAAQKIRNIEKPAPHLEKLVIIAVSAHAIESQKQKAFDYGMDDFLTKPFSQAELKTILKKHNILE
ncbi:hypothetical protein A9Q81_16435 [Gammaproteobacteria bacterium 42_54_T18]|nr:hypothetical protein A9Q81_16435 [Gammaproteobacteria bacterium 42_54_T18]